ncbi:MAG: hypothetical protein ACI9SB_002652, partial [Candidatus Azotimanducaceae bacterium]
MCLRKTLDPKHTAGHTLERLHAEYGSHLQIGKSVFMTFLAGLVERYGTHRMS